MLCLSTCCQVEGLPEKASLLFIFLLIGSRYPAFAWCLPVNASCEAQTKAKIVSPPPPNWKRQPKANNEGLKNTSREQARKRKWRGCKPSVYSVEAMWVTGYFHRILFCCLHLFSVTWYCVWTDSILNLGKP